MTNTNFKNYIDHEINVQIIDGILSRATEWDWFINYVNDNFDLNDITNWNDFNSKLTRLKKVYAHIIRIIEIGGNFSSLHPGLTADLFHIAKFQIGEFRIEEISSLIDTLFGEVFLLVVWLTKLHNSGNESDDWINYRVLLLKNYSNLVNMVAFVDVQDEIISYAKAIKLDGWEEPLRCLLDNLNNIHYPYQDDFFEKYGDALYNADAFSFQRLKSNTIDTWEEKYLLDMVHISFDDGKIIPAFISGTLETPDSKIWDQRIITHMIDFFNNHVATFILESIQYIIFGVIPSNDTVLSHCTLLTDHFRNNECHEALRCSSFKMISYLFENKAMKLVLNDEPYRLMLKELKKCDFPEALIEMQESFIPISKSQKEIIKKYSINQFSLIDGVSSRGEFLNFLDILESPRYINNEQFEKINDKFYFLVSGGIDALVPSLFYEFMVFLFDINHKGVNVDKKKVNQAMIDLQNLWQDEYHQKQIENMQVYRIEEVIKVKEIEDFNKGAITDPVGFARSIMITTQESLIELLKSISEHPILYSVSAIDITKYFPIKRELINYKSDSVEEYLKSYIEEILENYGYKLRNRLDIDTYVQAINVISKQNLLSSIPLLIDEEQLYEEVTSRCSLELIEYERRLKLAHITQLFPILEIKIRDLAKLLGIVTFKIQKNNFMSFKDPSSLLREIIKEVFDISRSFDRIPDILFVYNVMFNTNSLNIRNELIHGRNYEEGDGLHFAFRATLISILMIQNRIDVLLNN